MDIKQRFLQYVSIDTQSSHSSDTFPTTPKQLELANLLVKELHELGLVDSFVDEFGIVYGRLKANSEGFDPIGLIAHIDTSPDSPGNNIKPQIISKYDGSIITLNKEQNITLDPKQFSHLNEVINHELITTDGTTLLGADDKAGIAVIMDVLQTLIQNPSIQHGDIAIAFTPDEEVGKGTTNFDVDIFNAKYAYTIDGGSIHDIGYQNFNAYNATIHITGKSVHPGDAKLKMVNALLVAMEIENMLPPCQKPQFTEGSEGFYHLHQMEGTCLKTTMAYILRDHDLNKIHQQIQQLKNIQTYLNTKYEYNIIQLDIEESYLNMYEIIKKDMTSVLKLEQAYNALHIPYTQSYIRGGTDGARLSFMGIPCPNIGAGGFNFHGCYEFLSVDMMKQSTQIVLQILTNK